MSAYVQDVRKDDDVQPLLFKIGRIFAAAMTGIGSFAVRPTVTAVNSSTTAATFTSTTKTVAATGTPEALTGVSTLVESVAISPLRTNTGTAYVGFAATNDVQTMVTPLVITAPPGKKIDLSLIYVDVTVAGEGVRYATIN